MSTGADIHLMAGWSVWPASTFTTGNMNIAISSKHIRLIGEGFLGIILLLC
jgi:hypothetical protein